MKYKIGKRQKVLPVHKPKDNPITTPGPGSGSCLFFFWHASILKKY